MDGQNKDKIKKIQTNDVETSSQTEVNPSAEQKLNEKKKNKKLQSNDKHNDNSSESKIITKLISIRRVSKSTKGGRTMKLSAFVVVGNGEGRIGLGVGKGEDVKQAQEKAIRSAKRNMINFKLKGSTIPHDISFKYKAAKIILKPAKEGVGVVAGSSVRLVAEAAGIKDMYSKILGTNNPITNAYAVYNALKLVNVR
jgi:small subunit ribosomal protein S5